jgi:hypothetical protein
MAGLCGYGNKIGGLHKMWGDFLTNQDTGFSRRNSFRGACSSICLKHKQIWFSKETAVSKAFYMHHL